MVQNRVPLTTHILCKTGLSIFLCAVQVRTKPHQSYQLFPGAPTTEEEVENTACCRNR